MKAENFPTLSMRIRSTITFGVANLLTILPLISFALPTKNGLMAYILFYSGTKTGLLLVNGLGKVQNAYRLTRNSLLVAFIASLALSFSHLLLLNDIFAFLLGAMASIVLPAFQALYYQERVAWHWSMGMMDILMLVPYATVFALSILYSHQFSVTLSFLFLTLFIAGGIITLLAFSSEMKGKDLPIFVKKTSSTSDLALFIGATALIFALRYLRNSNNLSSLLIAFILIVGALFYLGYLGIRSKIKIDFPPQSIVLAFINGAFESFVMLYLVFGLSWRNNLVFAYLCYALGILLAQVLRKLVQRKLFKHLSDLKVQFLFFLVGMWLLFTPQTLFIGVLLISFAGSSNSILLNHQIYFLPIETPAERLITKYRNSYLGNIVFQTILVLGFLGLSGHVMGNPLETIQGIFIALAIVLTVLLIVLGIKLPGVDENDLF